MNNKVNIPAVIIGSYFLAAFVTWEINPGKWMEEARVTVAIVISMVIPALVALNLINKKTKK